MEQRENEKLTEEQEAELKAELTKAMPAEPTIFETFTEGEKVKVRGFLFYIKKVKERELVFRRLSKELKTFKLVHKEE